MKVDRLTLLMWSVFLMLSCSTTPQSTNLLEAPPDDAQIIQMYVMSMIPIREQQLFIDTCRQLSLRPSLAAALGWHESELKAYIVGRTKNANGTIDRGTFQLNSGEMGRFQREFWNGKPFDPFDGKENMLTGLSYLRDRIDLAKGDVLMGLRLYNAGPSALLKKSYAGLDYALTVLADEQEIIDAARLSWYESSTSKASL